MDIVWHYTTLDTLAKILSSQTLLATEANFQNDPNEVAYSENLLKEAIKRASRKNSAFAATLAGIGKHVDEPGRYSLNINRLLETSRFLLCGSTDGDSMYCWRTYGAVGGVACAIGFDASVPLKVAGVRSSQSYRWTPVIYAESQVAAEVDALVEEIRKEYDASAIDSGEKNIGILIVGYGRIRSMITTLAKSASFSNEKESRITVRKPNPAALVIGAGAAWPRPRVALGSTTPSVTSSSEDNGALPIVEVRLGPAAPLEAKQSLEWILAAHKYSIDGVEEYVEYEDEQGNTLPDSYINEDRRVVISQSKHAFRNV
jgi:hypothetical protein